MRALLLVHRCSPLAAQLVTFLRDRGFEPFVLSSAPIDHGAGEAFRAACAELDVEHHVSQSGELAAGEVLDGVAGLAGVRFCLSIWPGQRALMAQVNRTLGAADVAPDAVALAQSDDRMRDALAARGLSASANGRELAVEVVRQDGRTAFAVEYERTAHGFAAPPVTVPPEQVAAARALAGDALDALGLGHGCCRVELRVDDAGECRVAAVQALPGGLAAVDGVRLGFGRSLLGDWVDVLTGAPVSATERQGGSYWQVAAPEPGRQPIGVDLGQQPAPDESTQPVQLYAFTPDDAEVCADLAATTRWSTDLAGHRETVAGLDAAPYRRFAYAKGLAGRPLFLVFEPTNHMYQVVEAADRLGYDVVVFHTLPILGAGPYAYGRDGIALSCLHPSWDSQEAWFASVLDVCAGAQVAGTYAAQEIALVLEARVQEHFGLPGKGSATVRDLLDKVNTRRHLVQAGLSKLRLFTEPEVDALIEADEWPVGDHALFFKPVHGAGSAYVKRCADLEQLRAAVAEWRAVDKAAIPVLGPYLESDGGAFFVEEEAVGELLSVEGYVYQDRYQLIGLTSRTVLARDIAVEMGTTYPYEHSRRDEIVEVVARIHKTLGVSYGGTHTEVIVPPDGDIELVELNLRFIGADALAAMDAAHGVKFEDDLVRLGAGERPSLPLATSNFACMQFILAPPGLKRVDSLELPDEEMVFVKIIRPPGSELASTDRQIDWIAAFIVCGPTYGEAVRRAIDIRRRTRVNGAPLGDNPNNVVIAR